MKKNWICRALSLVLVIVMLASLLLTFASCNNKSMGPTYLTIGYTNDDGTEGFVEVPYDMVYCFVKQELMAYTQEQLQDENVRAKARENVINNLIERHYIVRVIAKQLDLGLTADARANIEATMEIYRSYKDYESMLKEMYATDAVTEELVTVTELDTVVYDFLCEFNEVFDDDPQKILADIETGKWYAAEYFVLEYDGVNHDARKKDMQEVRDAMLAGQSMKDASAQVQKYYKDEY